MECPIAVSPSDHLVFGSNRSPKKIKITNLDENRSMSVRVRIDGDEGIASHLAANPDTFDLAQADDAEENDIKEVTISIRQGIFVRENVHDSLLYIEYRMAGQPNWEPVNGGPVRVFCGDFPSDVF